jgi:hypothetical protein
MQKACVSNGVTAINIDAGQAQEVHLAHNLAEQCDSSLTAFLLLFALVFGKNNTQIHWMRTNVQAHIKTNSSCIWYLFTCLAASEPWLRLFGLQVKCGQTNVSCRPWW